MQIYNYLFVHMFVCNKHSIINMHAMNITVIPLYWSMKMVPTPCINIVLWAWLNEWFSMAWGPVKGGFLLQQVVVWFSVGSSVMSREREIKERCCDKKWCLVQNAEQILEI